ncbi:MAG: AAA family ATPase, partial [Clostridia bacterium]|nr:AAA family ATPase [Clostridia bacterium]
NENIAPYDIVFFADESGFEDLKSNDQRVNQYVRASKIFKVVLKDWVTDASELDFNKVYFVSNAEYVNLPMLNFKQQELVEIENKNLLVQGVAGSGKTNICISKIIFVACRNYTGKILYTTFSRGLLVDTKNKIELFKNNIKQFIEDYRNNRIVFLDKNHKTAIENRLGIFLIVDNETNLLKKLDKVVQFLENNVDYYLIEDLYKREFEEQVEMADEDTFVREFLKNVNNHQLKSRLDKIKNLSYSIIYKEVYGLIFGAMTENETAQMLDFEEYKRRRENSFSANECEVIYGIAKLYAEYQKTQNLYDNNKISRKLLENSQKIKKYSLSIIDEVQDFTEVNLNLFKKISIKMFAVGDALQMINPSYFSFAYLKRLMYDEDLTSVAELESNYRNNKKIVEILDDLSDLNTKQFGTHSFVLTGKSVDEDALTNVVYSTDESFAKKLKNQKFENFTILVNDLKQKQQLREMFKKQEILTISEVKGLERDTVLLYNVLSSNKDKWKILEEFNINHKQADENSVFRYYFNLFYVGVSRAKHNLFVFENDEIKLFSDFFKDNFENLNGEETYKKFTEVISKIEIDDDEILERIAEFIKLGQFDNARFYADKFEDDEIRIQQNEKIEAFEKFVFKGRNKDAGIKLWKAGLISEAKEQFAISGDTKLVEFLENLEGKNKSKLDAEIVKFYVDFDDNDEAQKLIVDVVKADLRQMQENHRIIKEKFKELNKKFKEKK